MKDHDPLVTKKPDNSGSILAWSLYVMAVMNFIPLTLLSSQDRIMGLMLYLIVFFIAVIDLRSFVVPDVGVASLFSIGVFGDLILLRESFVAAIAQTLPDAVLRALLLGGALMLIAFLFRRARGVDGLGFGDIKLYAAGGAWLSLPTAINALTLAALTALIVAVLSGLRRSGQLRLPFAVFLAPAIFAGWCAERLLP